MEHEKRSGKLAEYVERWRGDVFEVMAYAGRIFINKTYYSHCLIIPLPPNFEFPDNIKSFPNSILIMENKERVKRKGRKYTRPLGPFLGGKLGSTSALVTTLTGEFGPRSKIWIDKETFMRITKRNLYVDEFYADQIFNRGKDNSSL